MKSLTFLIFAFSLVFQNVAHADRQLAERMAADGHGRDYILLQSARHDLAKPIAQPIRLVDEVDIRNFMHFGAAGANAQAMAIALARLEYGDDFDFKKHQGRVIQILGFGGYHDSDVAGELGAYYANLQKLRMRDQSPTIRSQLDIQASYNRAMLDVVEVLAVNKNAIDKADSRGDFVQTRSQARESAETARKLAHSLSQEWLDLLQIESELRESLTSLIPNANFQFRKSSLASVQYENQTQVVIAAFPEKMQKAMRARQSILVRACEALLTRFDSVFGED